jgi:hypothetical protein
MKQTVNFTVFSDAFNRSQYKNNFTYDGLRALFDYWENYQDETSEEIELDVCALCCEFTEYENLKAFQHDYSVEWYPDIEAIEKATTVIMIDDESFIIQSF